jgi:hypothetical protein
MIYHLLRKPIKPLERQRIQWECVCGLNIALPAVPTQPGTAIQVPDEKTGANIVECAACYNASDEKGEMPVPYGRADNERDLNPTFDTDLGEEDDEEAAPDEQITDEVLSEEREEFPE